MISEGGPVAFDPDLIDTRVLVTKYDYVFPRPSGISALEEYFSTQTYDEESLVNILTDHVGKDDRKYDRGHLQGLLGEVFLANAIEQCSKATGEIELFPEHYEVGEFEIARRHPGYVLRQSGVSEKGKPFRKEIDEFDGLVYVVRDDGVKLPVIIESKVTESNWINRGLNSAINPDGARDHTSQLRDLLGPVGYCVVGAKDRIIDTIPLQKRFRENGGVLMAFPFTAEQALRIAGNVYNSLATQVAV